MNIEAAEADLKILGQQKIQAKSFSLSLLKDLQINGTLRFKEYLESPEDADNIAYEYLINLLSVGSISHLAILKAYETEDGNIHLLNAQALDILIDAVFYKSGQLPGNLQRRLAGAQVQIHIVLGEESAVSLGWL